MYLGLFAGESIQLMPDGTLFVHIAIILLMIYVLNRTLFKPVNKILAAREEMIRRGGGAAADILQRVEEGISRYERSLRDARTEGYQLLERERAEASARRQAALESVREEIAQSISKQKDELNRQAEAARAVLNSEAQRLAARISAQVLS